MLGSRDLSPIELGDQDQQLGGRRIDLPLQADDRLFELVVEHAIEMIV
jgi:hypothetical protein